MTDLKSSVALVTGASRGVGAEIVAQLLQRGATKVYAAARNPDHVTSTDPRVVPVRLDVTDADSVAAAAALATDVTVLVNNAGIADSGPILGGSEAGLRAQFETNFFGPLRVAEAFAPALRSARGGVLVNVASVLSWTALAGGYSASKAALWSATNSLRLELAGDGVQVVGLHMAYVDTDMTAGIDAPKSTPAQIVTRLLDGVEAGDLEVLADDLTVAVRGGLSAPVREQYPQLV